VRTPVHAPNANAYAERFVRSIREECLDRLILFGERRLLRALDEFVAHYHRERNHQGLGNELITPATAAAGGTRVRCRDRLGGLLRYYHRAAGPRAWDEFSDTTPLPSRRGRWLAGHHRVRHALCRRSPVGAGESTAAGRSILLGPEGMADGAPRPAVNRELTTDWLDIRAAVPSRLQPGRPSRLRPNDVRRASTLEWRRP
jgi:hypothetical protein